MFPGSIKIKYAVLLALIQISISGSMYGWPSLLTAIKRQNRLSHTDDTLNWIFTAGLISRMALGPVLGLINDKWSPKVLLMLSCLISCLATTLLTTADDSLLRWIIGFVLYSNAGNGVNLGVLTSARDLFPEHTVQYTSIMNGLSELSTLWFTFMNAINARYEYFFLMIAIFSVIAVGLLPWKPDYVWKNRDNIDTTDYFQQIRGKILSLDYILYVINHMIMFYWLVYYLGTVKPRMDLIGLYTEQDLVSIFSIVLAVLGFILSFIIGWLVAKLGLLRSWMMVYVLFLSWTAFLILPASIPTIIIGFVLFALANQCYFTVSVNYLAKQYGYDILGRLISVSFFFTTPLIFAQTPLLSTSLNMGNFWLADGLQIATLLSSVGFLIYMKHNQS